MIDINELRRLAQAATPGPWGNTDPDPTIINSPYNQLAICYRNSRALADAKFIAAANPAAISELLDRLEAAERERDALHDEIACVKEVEFPRKAQAVADAWKGKCERLKAERDILNAKVEAMGQQKPVAFALYSGWALKATYRGEHEACEQRDRRQLTADLSGSLEAYRVEPLYALPSAQAQPAPSVPTALLVAVADLVAQMEIVARVGFVDAPDDKDSCAAFCVAEGTWLELVECVESLTLALAKTAPEDKPCP